MPLQLIISSVKKNARLYKWLLLPFSLKEKEPSNYDDQKHSHDIELHDVGHIPNSGINLISLGHLLQAGAKVTGETNTITVTYGDSDILAPFTTGFLGWNMYTLKASLVHSHALGTIDYQTVHCHLGHPSKEVVRQAKQHTSGLPNFTIPENSTICLGCTKGKQPQ